MSILTRRGVTAGLPTPEQPIADFESVAYGAWDMSDESFNDNDPIATLTDQVGTNNLTQGTVDDQPLKQTQNGIPVARFDGTNDYLSTGLGATLSQPYTFIALARYAVTSGDMVMFGGGDISGRPQVYRLNSTGNHTIYSGSSFINSGVSTDTNWHVFVAEFGQPGNDRLYLDGGTPIIDSNSGSHSMWILHLGAGYSPSLFLNGDVNYLGLYDGNLVTDDLPLLNSVASDLAARVGNTWTNIT